jgi:hypothetical protein
MIGSGKANGFFPTARTISLYRIVPSPATLKIPRVSDFKARYNTSAISSSETNCMGGSAPET